MGPSSYSQVTRLLRFLIGPFLLLRRPLYRHLFFKGGPIWVLFLFLGRSLGSKKVSFLTHDCSLIRELGFTSDPVLTLG